MSRYFTGGHRLCVLPAEVFVQHEIETESALLCSSVVMTGLGVRCCKVNTDALAVLPTGLWGKMRY